jgi:hypothetical protein
MKELLDDTLTLLQRTFREGGFPNPEISKSAAELMERLDKKIYPESIIEDAFISGYYCNGYTYDSTFAKQEAQKYVNHVKDML